MALKLGQVLVQKGLLTEEQLKQGLDAQVIYGGHLGTCLVQLGFVELDRLGEVLAEQFQIPDAARERFLQIDPAVIATIPAGLAKRHQAIPFALEDRVLKVAMMDPRDLLAIDELSFAYGYKVEAWIAPEILLCRALELYYGIPRELRHVPISLHGTKHLVSMPKQESTPTPSAEPTAASPEAPQPPPDTPDAPDESVIDELRSIADSRERDHDEEWLSAEAHVLEEQSRSRVHIELEAERVSPGKLSLEWIKRRSGEVQRWCELYKVPLDDPHFNHLSGVFVAWREGRDPVLSVGQGYIRNELSTLKLDPRIRTAAAETRVYVSWAQLDREQLDRVERFLGEMLRPVFNSVMPDAPPLEVNLPC